MGAGAMSTQGDPEVRARNQAEGSLGLLSCPQPLHSSLLNHELLVFPWEETSSTISQAPGTDACRS